MQTRKHAHTSLSLAFLSCLVLTRARAAEPVARPNMLVILADDLGYGDLSYMGAKDLKSPHIDSLAARGMKFTNFYANCPVCSPTRAALISGRYQDLVGVPGVVRTHANNNWGYLDPKAIMLPKLLQENGYHTAIVGKWHLGLESPNKPNERGFDYFRGFLGDMMDDYYHHRRHGNNYMRHDEKVIDPKGHATDLFTNWASDYIRDRKKQAADKPWFLYLAYNAPHTPIQPPKDWFEKVKKREPGITDKRAKLVALIEHMDDGIGKVLKALEESGQADNTIVVFTSDNGGQLSAGANNGALRDGKQSVYQGGLKVPTCVVWPGNIEAGKTTECTAMSMDILPTLFDGAGLRIGHQIEGRSFLRSLKQQSQPPLRNKWFFSRREGGLRYGGKTIEAVIKGDWKLLQNSPWEPLELYNLANDPQEEENLAEKNRKKFGELNADLRLQLQQYGRVPWQKP